MTARIRKLVSDLGDTFWLVPWPNGLGRSVDRARLRRTGSQRDYSPMASRRWLYNGGGTGARSLLGTVSASTIGVAGTVFSITIAALSFRWAWAPVASQLVRCTPRRSVELGAISALSFAECCEVS